MGLGMSARIIRQRCGEQRERNSLGVFGKLEAEKFDGCEGSGTCDGGGAERASLHPTNTPCLTFSLFSSSNPDSSSSFLPLQILSSACFLPLDIDSCRGVNMTAHFPFITYSLNSVLLKNYENPQHGIRMTRRFIDETLKCCERRVK